MNSAHDKNRSANTHQVVIIGGGFGGLYAAKFLKRTPVCVTLLDRRNFHLFQPLLYQVATGGLSPGDISAPLRSVLKSHKNVTVILGEAVDIDPSNRVVKLIDGEIHYDTLVVATGVKHHYFGNDQWSDIAPGLKTIEDALNIRSRILLAFEAAEREHDPEIRKAWQTFVLIGGGPTGVELAGALGELSRATLKHDFRNINPGDSKIILVEATDRILQSYPLNLSIQAERALTKLGVTIECNSMVTEIEPGTLHLQQKEKTVKLQTKTVLWTAGVQASSFTQKLVERTEAKADQYGRIYVQKDLSIEGYPEILVIGDSANFSHQTGNPLPGVSPVAMKQGLYAARLIRNRIAGKDVSPFKYFNKGNLAVIGRNAAVADLGFLKFHGFFAWLLWIFIHIAYLIEFDNRILVLFQWATNYFTRKRGARLITGEYSK